jgi:hypothetical protein
MQDHRSLPGPRAVSSERAPPMSSIPPRPDQLPSSGIQYPVADPWRLSQTSPQVSPSPPPAASPAAPPAKQLATEGEEQASPKKKRKETTQAVYLRLPESLAENIRLRAMAEGVSQAALITALLSPVVGEWVRPYRRKAS